MPSESPRPGEQPYALLTESIVVTDRNNEENNYSALFLALQTLESAAAIIQPANQINKALSELSGMRSAVKQSLSNIDQWEEDLTGSILTDYANNQDSLKEALKQIQDFRKKIVNSLLEKFNALEPRIEQLETRLEAQLPFNPSQELTALKERLREVQANPETGSLQDVYLLLSRLVKYIEKSGTSSLSGSMAENTANGSVLETPPQPDLTRFEAAAQELANIRGLKFEKERKHRVQLNEALAQSGLLMGNGADQLTKAITSLTQLGNWEQLDQQSQKNVALFAQIVITLGSNNLPWYKAVEDKHLDMHLSASDKTNIAKLIEIIESPDKQKAKTKLFSLISNYLQTLLSKGIIEIDTGNQDSAQDSPPRTEERITGIDNKPPSGTSSAGASMLNRRRKLTGE